VSALDEYNERRRLEQQRTRSRKKRPVTPKAVRALPCAVCGGGPTQVHHIVPRSSFGAAAKHRQNEEANLMPLCETCHVDHHTTARRVPRWALSPAAVEFVRQMKGEGWLDRWYPIAETTGARA
jgi:5-methylcytosine-specific restriction endonuclease McrA